jgi:hypothetical protein
MPGRVGPEIRVTLRLGVGHGIKAVQQEAQEVGG